MAPKYSANSTAERDLPLRNVFDITKVHPTFSARFQVSETGTILLLRGCQASLVGKVVAYSRSRDFYSGRADLAPFLTYRRVIAEIEALSKAGLISGDIMPPNLGGRQSVYWLEASVASEVLHLLDTLPKLKPRHPHALTQLRNEQNEEIPFSAYASTKRAERNTRLFNEAILSSDVYLPYKECPILNYARPLVRIFNVQKSLRWGGRYYAQGDSWQNMRLAARASLTIDGEPVSELDYSALHPTLLYAEAGLPAPRDCYALEGWPRALVKKALLILINASTYREAVHALNDTAEMHEERQYRFIEGGALRLIDDLKTLYKPIASAFHSSAGMRLMRTDSDIAERVLVRMIKQKGIVTLPVHDSFIVQSRHGDALREAMLDAAAEAGIPRVRVRQET